MLPPELHRGKNVDADQPRSQGLFSGREKTLGTRLDADCWFP